MVSILAQIHRFLRRQSKFLYTSSVLQALLIKVYDKLNYTLLIHSLNNLSKNSMQNSQNSHNSQFLQQNLQKIKKNSQFFSSKQGKNFVLGDNLQQAMSLDQINLKTKIQHITNEEIFDENQPFPIRKIETQSRGSSNQSLKTQKNPQINIDSKIQKLSPNQSLNSTNSFNRQYLSQLNFSKIPLCCRTFFFDQERILPGEDKFTEYKSYRLPFNSISYETFKKTVCGFLNSCGGDIYIGIKETTNRKYRYVLGNYLTQNDKEEIMKTFRKISQSIFPNATGNLQIEFVPIRSNPFPNIDLLGHCQTYFYDFSKKPLNLNNCPFLPGRYVVRVRVSAGNKMNLYTYIETEYQLNKNSSSKEFVAFRSQNQVLVKEISYQVLKIFKNRILYEQQKDFRVHSGPCLKPEIGNPQNQPLQFEDLIDAKTIQSCLYQRTKKRQSIEREKTVENKKIQQRNRAQYFNNATSKGNQVSQTSSESLKVIFRYPLSFIAKNISQQRLRRCVQKTPAKNYALIEKEKNILSGEQLLIVTVNNYHNMEQFLRIKSSIQNFFKQDNVQLLPISNSIRLQNIENKKVAEALLNKYSKQKWVINKNVLEFYSIVVAASFYLRMKQLGFEMQIIAM